MHTIIPEYNGIGLVQYVERAFGLEQIPAYHNRRRAGSRTDRRSDALTTTATDAAISLRYELNF